MNVAQIFASSLVSFDVKRVYGLIGTSVLDFIDALSYIPIRYVSTRHEQVAVSMADAEGRLTGFPGVAVVHGGPGLLNSLVSLASAYKDSSPLLLIAGAVKRRLRGLDGWLEVPQTELVKPFTKLALRVDRPAEAASAISTAFWKAASVPKGPCFVEVPEDVWSLEAGNEPNKGHPEPVQTVSDQFVRTVADLLKSSNRPLLLVGGGLNTPYGAAAVKEFAEVVGIYVVTTGNGRGIIPEDHPMCVGRVGFGGGNIVADYALTEADLLIAAGCGVSDVTTYGFNMRPKGVTVVVDFDPLSNKPIKYDYHARGDAANFLTRLKGLAVKPASVDGWQSILSEKRREWEELLIASESKTKVGYVNPSKFFRELGSRLPPNCTVTGGQGLHILYAHAYLKAREYGSFLEATNLGAMGFAFPAALGAKLAAPGRIVISVLGDGEFMMTMQDIETAVRERIPIRIVVVNDSSYRVLLMRQMVQKTGRVYGTVHQNPVMKELGKAFGFRSMTVLDDSEISSAVDFLLDDNPTTTVVELIVDPEHLPPFNLEASLKF
jgi:acetolactate synthase-1/2/3 large subunit